MINLSISSNNVIEQMLALIDQFEDNYDDVFDPAIEELERQFAELRLTFMEA